MTGFAAIEVVAKCVGLRLATAALWLAAVMKGAPGEMLRAFALQAAREAGLAGSAHALKPHKARAAGTKCKPDAALIRVFCSFFRSK